LPVGSFNIRITGVNANFQYEVIIFQRCYASKVQIKIREAVSKVEAASFCFSFGLIRFSF